METIRQGATSAPPKKQLAKKPVSRERLHVKGQGKIVVNCPYCSNKTIVNVQGKNALVNCDTVDGGCDRVFVVKLTTVVKSETKTVEGE